MSPGYVTSAGREVSDGPAYWTTGWEHRFQAGHALFVLHAANAWWLLEGWRARRQYAWDAGSASVLGLLSETLRRVGLTLSASPRSDTVDAHRPQFTISPGERGDAVVRRLLALAPDVLSFRGHRGQLRYLQPDDAADYVYGAGHPILEGSHGESAQAHTRVQVFGAAGVAEAFVWDEMALLGERLLQHHDLNLDTLAKAESRSREIVRRLEREAVSGEITVPVNCGQELDDVVEITDRQSRHGGGASEGPGHGPRLPAGWAAPLPSAADAGGRVARARRAHLFDKLRVSGGWQLRRGVRQAHHERGAYAQKGTILVEMRKAMVKSFSSATYRATVQVAGSLATWLADVPVARNIAAVGDGHGPVLRRAVLRPRRARGCGGRGGVRLG